MTTQTDRKPSRRTQERTEQTRAKLLEAATLLFTEHGFEGVSISELEQEAGVHRGLLAYHFKDKENLWKAMADRTFAPLMEDTRQRADIMKELPAREQLALVVRHYVRFCAQHPELPRLMSQEARHPSWRIEYLVEHYGTVLANNLHGPVLEALGLRNDQFMHWFYFVAGASSLIFSHAPECELLFGIDPRQESVVEAHAEMMVTALLGLSDQSMNS